MLYKMFYENASKSTLLILCQNIDKGIQKGKSKVAWFENPKKTHGFSCT